MTTPEPYHIAVYKCDDAGNWMARVDVGGYVQLVRIPHTDEGRAYHLALLREFLDALYETGREAGRKELT